MSASERRSSARTAVVWEALQPVLDRRPGQDVLDIGGGTGGFAVRVAELGHRVRVVDPSPDALASLERRARESGVQVEGVQGDLTDLGELVSAASEGGPGFDVVLCHGVLEVVDDTAAALATLHRVVRPGGTLSLLVAQRHAAVVARAMAGHFEQARALLVGAADRGRAGHRFTHDELAAALPAAGLQIDSVHAVRVFADLVPGSLLDLEPGAAQALVALERTVAERPDYFPLAAQLHVLAHR